MTNNYFRIKNSDVCVFFNDESLAETARAYKEAKSSAVALESTALLFRPCLIEGPWNNIPLVGHRARLEILDDILKSGTNVDECILRSLELTALDQRFSLGLEGES